MLLGTHVTNQKDKNMLTSHKTPRARATAAAIALLSSVSMVVAQTKIVAPDNKYSVAEDVTPGRHAARQDEEQLPIRNDSAVQSYCTSIGERLAESITQ